MSDLPDPEPGGAWDGSHIEGDGWQAVLLFVPGEPKTKGSVKIRHGPTCICRLCTKKGRLTNACEGEHDWADRVCNTVTMELYPFNARYIMDRVALHALFVMPGEPAGDAHRCRPDRDKLLRSVQDSVAKSLGLDDGVIDDGRTGKVRAGKHVRGVWLCIVWGPNRENWYTAPNGMSLMWAAVNTVRSVSRTARAPRGKAASGAPTSAISATITGPAAPAAGRSKSARSASTS